MKIQIKKLEKKIILYFLLHSHLYFKLIIYKKKLGLKQTLDISLAPYDLNNRLT